MKKKISIFTLLLLVLLSSFIFVSCKKEEKIDYDFTYNGVNFKTYTVHTELQKTVYDAGPTKANVYVTGLKELSYPEPVKLTWEGNNESYQVMISLSKDLSNSTIYNVTTNELKLYNLFINKPYYYQVNSDGKVVTSVLGFIIEDDCPRNLYIDGVTNARDVGGWDIGNNQEVKQGMLIRCAKFNEDNSTNILITQEGINVLIQDLKIKTELDLRKVELEDELLPESGGITTSPLGEGVNYISLPMLSGGDIIYLNKDKLKDLFSILGNIDNYPIVFHCSIGTDRTGMVSFLVNGLLGVSNDDLYRDYLFSNFGLIYKPRNKSMVDEYFKDILSYGGETVQEQIYNMLIAEGAEKSDIDNFISFMKDDKFTR